MGVQGPPDPEVSKNFHKKSSGNYKFKAKIVKCLRNFSSFFIKWRNFAENSRKYFQIFRNNFIKILENKEAHIRIKLMHSRAGQIFQKCEKAKF